MGERRWQRVSDGGTDEFWVDAQLAILVGVRGEVDGVLDGRAAIVE
jgi:hypothetical protein